MASSHTNSTNVTRGGNGDSTHAARLREKVADALEKVSGVLLSHAAATVHTGVTAISSKELDRAHELGRFLGQVAAAWADLPFDALPEGGAGFGSAVTALDLDDATRKTYTLVAGPLLDINAGQVSLASPLGQALLGAHRGDVVLVHAPQRRLRLRILAVRTLEERLSNDVTTLIS